MRWVRLASLSVVWACSSGSNGPVSLAPTIIFPQGLLDNVTKITVSVYDTSGGALDCASDGTVSGLSGQVPLATKDLGTSNCPTGAKFCGDISIDKSGDARLFAAQSFIGSASSPNASGCTKATANQDNVQVQIKMLRTLPPSTCNGQASATITQCDTTNGVGDPVCDPNCQSLEEYFSSSDLPFGTPTTSDTKAKVRPQLAWPSANGDPGRLIGVWGDKSPGGGTEASMRILADDMRPYTGNGTCIQAASFRIPALTSQIPCPGQPYALPQFDPTVAAINGTYYIAFEDGGPVAIKIRSYDPNINPLQANPVTLSAATANAQTLPSMAANGNNLFVAWENNGTIVGKTIDSGLATPGTQQTIGTGTHVTVAAAGSGWVVAWQNGTDVQMAKIDSTGAASGVTKVSSAAGATNPGIAAFGTSVAVIWVDGGGNVLVQRYANGTAVANDQSTALQSVSGGNQSTPSIAAGTNFFIATWVDTNSGHVRARFLDGTGGFMFNAVNGQSSDFQVSTVDGETRANPVAIAGGSGPFVAIAWEDNTGAPGSFKGIWGRRFPLPQ